MQTRYGPGDSATWGRPTGHPHDPRTPDEDGVADTMLLYLDELPVLVGYYAGDSYGMRYAAADIEITDAAISGHAIEPGHFALETLREWQQAIADEINSELDMAADCAAFERLEDGRD